jgi:hypothetical protein
MMTRTFSFDTSSFLPHRTPAGQWQRFTLEMTEAEETHVFARREKLWENASTGKGSTAEARRYDRWIVKRFSV